MESGNASAAVTENPPGQVASINAEFDLTELLTTPGLSRSGFIQYDILLQGIASVHFGVEAQAQLGPLSALVPLSSPGEGCVGCPLFGFVTVPFQLGQPFTADLVLTMGGTTFEIFDLSNTANASGEIDFRLFEADGVTAVDPILAAPEPSTLLLLSPAALLLGLRRQRRTRRK
jgi:hypothetical protein